MMITIWMETLVLSMTVILIYHKMSLNINNINKVNNINNNNNILLAWLEGLAPGSTPT